MPPNKYHVIVFIGILVMLLLLGLHLLGVGFGSVQVSADGRTSASALARNSSQASSSSLNNGLGAAGTNALSQAYRHPIVYDKMTGATNNQINDILGSKQPALNEYPLDHYQHQLQLQKQQQQSQRHSLGPSSPDDFFTGHMHHRAPFATMQPVGPHLPPMTPPPPMSPHHMSPPMGLPPPPPPPQMQRDQQQVSQQQSPQQQQQSPSQRQRPLQQSSVELANASPSTSDSLPSASSNNGSARPLANTTQQVAHQVPQSQSQVQQQLQYRPPSAYYTPPIFAYNSNNNNIEPIQFGGNQAQTGDPISFHNASPQQLSPAAFQPQQPPLGVPEVPMSLDEYNMRLARLRQINQPQHLAPQAQSTNEATSAQQQQQQDNLQASRYGKQRTNALEPNLLADPQQQQLHKQQMLAERQQLIPFGQQQQQPQHHHFGMPMPTMQPHLTEATPLSQMNQTSYYPSPNHMQTKLPVAQTNNAGSGIRPPYAHQMSPNAIDHTGPGSNTVLDQFGMKQPKATAQNRIMSTPEPSRSVSASSSPPSQSSQVVGSFVQPQAQQQVPTCARQPGSQMMLLAANSDAPSADQSFGGNNSSIGAAMFCQEDSEYPTRDIMRALETYANERSIEQLLPQSLVQLIVQKPTANQIGMVELQRQLLLDPLQANVNAVAQSSSDSSNSIQTGQQQQQLSAPGNMFPTANYEPMCKSNVYLAQPRRARNLMGQWKIIVNLPGHKYRGIAVSQMLRVEECSRPNSECAGNGSASITIQQQQQQQQQQNQKQLGGLATNRSTRCLQHYDYQRLVAWSHQQGLHVDVFRVPIACSCHIRR